MVNTRSMESSVALESSAAAPAPYVDPYALGTAVLQEVWDFVKPLVKNNTKALDGDEEDLRSTVEKLDECKLTVERFKIYSHCFLVHWTMADEISKMIDEVKNQIEFPLPPARRRRVA